MRIVKLDAGESLTMEVTAVEDADGKFGPQYEFQGYDLNGGDEVKIYLNPSTVDRQLARIEHTLQSVEGAEIVIEKVKKNGKTFVNIDRAAAGARTTRQNAPNPRSQEAALAAPQRSQGRDEPPPESDDEYQARMQRNAAPEPPALDPWADCLKSVAVQYDGAVKVAHAILTRHAVAAEPAAVQAMAFSIFRETVERVRRGGR